MPRYERVESPEDGGQQTRERFNPEVTGGAAERERLQNSLALDLEMLNQQSQKGEQRRMLCIWEAGQFGQNFLTMFLE